MPKKPPVPDTELRHPRVRADFLRMKVLVSCYIALSVLALLVAYLWRNRPDLVTDLVWVRGEGVLIASVVLLLFVFGTTRGRRGAYLRLRIASAAMVVAIAVLISLPGFLPVWMRVEQGLCGLVLIGVAVIANGTRLRSLFAH
ncbi:hypothetical protein [Amycolatopsis azurea]|uniref:Putative Na+-dependent transporter n=1 Tax=Amycolatopsis azurea DSM 43854 TaxID=1238180 RepID=M2P471_9PSEU|nr:hypothetical protein [Amycolatopsis azurea]EMD29994.1 putative Na+-dependent transporter [Amycolatopsis azurea DSM 43854]OOC04761.1 hypothetical protein B0293_20085 [Amycolatopsis azurea DSM 43854]